MNSYLSINNHETALLPAVIYARMSTEHQQYSTENQCDVIREYALSHNMEIIKTYIDEGKSGLNLAGRDALQQLICDVTSPDRDFKAILVYDVSRWGRFQDADESAYYEYICKRAGVDVHYCAEQFANDGSITSTVFKSIKRAMAGEYSRELSSKVFKGQCRLIELGYRQGGPAGYGLRRVLIDQNGNIKTSLRVGEQKSIQTDRVILVPGPLEEVATVRWMYLQFVEGKKTEKEIADMLNLDGKSTDFGRPWTRGTVHQVLTNEKYIGNNIYNRTSFKLKVRRVINGRDAYIRADGAFEPIVDKAIFMQSQEIVAERSRRFTNDELLAKLKDVYSRYGKLSALIIDESDENLSSSTYRTRFGSLIRAYRMIGYVPDKDYRYLEVNRHIRKLHPEIMEYIITQILRQGSLVHHDIDTDLLTINDEFVVSVVVARCVSTRAGNYRWCIRLDTALNPDITVAVRMDAENIRPLDYYILPAIDINGANLKLMEINGLFFDAYRFDTLDYLIGMARRIPIMEVA